MEMARRWRCCAIRESHAASAGIFIRTKKPDDGFPLESFAAAALSGFLGCVSGVEYRHLDA